jgi:hypothetical protein
MTGRSGVTFSLISTVLVLISLLMGSSPKVSYGIATGVHSNQNISNSILQKTKQASQHILKTAYDKFGIEKIYPTKPSGQEWFMNMSAPIDNRTGGETPQTTFAGKNMADGSWKVASKEVRFGVLTSSGYRPDLITTLNQTELEEKGYMQSPNDWKNVEMTGYFKINKSAKSSDNGGPHIELLARGGRTTDSIKHGCEATSYDSNTYLDGRVKFEKDLMHTDGYTKKDPEKRYAITSPLSGRWIGIKAVFYNLPAGNVRMEQWIDNNGLNNKTGLPSNNLTKVFEFTDDGDWAGGHTKCGGSNNTVITWGGPIAVFRWDQIPDMDVKYFSVREIQE